jgi:molybdenum cofactor cytidylyltransferase
MRIVAIVLAAGEGRRIGGPKALVPIDGETFLERCIARLARPSVAAIVAVLGHDAERVAAQVRVPKGATIVVNPRHRDGMLSSILCGLDAADATGADAVLLHPVDHPLVEPATIDAVVAALLADASIAVPSYEDRRGHPGGFARRTWPALRAAAPERGARAVLSEHPDWVTHVVGGPDCRAGIDTPEDYRRLLGSDLARLS